MAIFNSDGIPIWYEIHGDGPAVLLIHGLGSSGLDWEHQLPALQDYRVICVDLRGHGLSARGAGVPVSIPLFARDLAALLDHLHVASVHVVGLSLGGGVAFQLALDRPQLVTTLTIVNSGPQAIVNPLLAMLVVNSRLAIIRLLGLPALGAKLARKLFPRPEHAEKRALFIQRFAGNDVHSYRATLKALIGWSVQSRLSELQMPVLVLAAEHDYTPVRLKRDYVQHLANARLVVIPGTRHALPIEDPDAFNAALLPFLRAHGCATQGERRQIRDGEPA